MKKVITVCAILLSFVFKAQQPGEFIDKRDGKTYKTTVIGTQTWMVENLNVSRFRNGDPIIQAKTAEQWQMANEQQKPAWCYYENKKRHGKNFGVLYNGYAVTDSRGLAPEGFHIPSDEEWTKLIHSTNDTLHSKTILNKLNFNLLLGGYRYDGGDFNEIEMSSYWWSTTEYYETNNAYLRLVEFNSTEVKSELHGYDWGFYVRCVKD
jgi:uncharacterized protein (TIGR02145 family)